MKGSLVVYRIPSDQFVKALTPLLKLLDLEPADTFHIVVDPDEVQAFYWLADAEGTRHLEPGTHEAKMSRRVLKVGH
jgi:hypothetical protein